MKKKFQATGQLSKQRKAIVDSLGEVKAQISDLVELETATKKAVANWGDGAYDGFKYRASVSSFDKKCVPNQVLVRQVRKLMGSKATAWLRTKTRRVPMTVVKVVARKTVK